MKYLKLSLLCSSVLLGACQTMIHENHGNAGYQVESQSANSAILSYTLAEKKNKNIEQIKLQKSCQKVLGNNKNYKIDILSTNYIANPQLQDQNSGVEIGHTGVNFGLANTQTNNPSLAADSLPKVLKVVRFSCN